MRVQVHQTGRYVETLRVDHVDSALRSYIGLDRGDLSIEHCDIRDTAKPAAGIDHLAALDQNVVESRALRPCGCESSAGACESHRSQKMSTFHGFVPVTRGPEGVSRGKLSDGLRPAALRSRGCAAHPRVGTHLFPPIAPRRPPDRPLEEFRHP